MCYGLELATEMYNEHHSLDDVSLPADRLTAGGVYPVARLL
jgi:hypothetical protein